MIHQKIGRRGIVGGGGGGRDGWDEVPWACLVMNHALVNLLSIFGDWINVFEKNKGIKLY